MVVRKVAHVVRRLSFADWGGIETAICALAKKLQERSIKSPIFCTSALSNPGRDSYLDVPIYRLRSTLPWFGLSEEQKLQLDRKGGNPLSWPLFKALLREAELDLIHTHVQNRLGGIARTVAKLRNIPYVVTLHGGMFNVPKEMFAKMMTPYAGHWEWGKAFGWCLGSRRVVEDADAVICVGRDEYEILMDKYPRKIVRYIPNGIDVHNFDKATPDLFRIKYGMHPAIICVARIDEQKNQRLLIEAFARFYKKNPDYRLYFIGPVSVKNYMNELQDLIRKYRLEEAVIFIQGLPAGDPFLPSAYKAAELVVLPSKNEPFGIVILEAWAAGVPVLASRVGGISGFTQHGKNALLFTTDSIDELTETLQSAIADSSLRRQLIEEGKAAVQAYDWEKICSQILALYREVL